MTENHQVDYDLFIAYSARDRDSAESLYASLVKQWRVFLDTKSLLPGDAWDQKIFEAQRHSRVTLVLLSSNTDSTYYAREEIAIAIDLARQQAHGHRIVPVYLEGRGRPVDVPYGLRRLHAIWPSKLHGIDEIVEQINHLMRRSMMWHPVGADTAPVSNYHIGTLASEATEKQVRRSKRRTIAALSKLLRLTFDEYELRSFISTLPLGGDILKEAMTKYTSQYTVKSLLRHHDVARLLLEKGMINDHFLDTLGQYWPQQIEEINTFVSRYENSTYCNTKTVVNKENIANFAGLLKQEELPFCLVYLDIDGFSLINRIYGKEIGDDILSCVSTILSFSVDTHFVFRCGSDEFAIVMPKTAMAEAMDYASTMSNRITGYSWSALASGLRVTACFGVSQFKDGEFPEEWVLRAIHGCIRSKEEGHGIVSKAPLQIPRGFSHELSDYGS